MIKVIKKVGGKIKDGSIRDIKSRNVTWVDAFRPANKELKEISAQLKLPMRTVAKYLDPDERPKVVEYKTCSVIVFGSPTKTKEPRVTPLAIFITRDTVITLRTDKIEAIDTVRNLLTDKGIALEKPSLFVHRLLSEIIDGFYKKLDTVEDELNAIETNVVRRPDKVSPSRIFSARKGLIYFHKALVANREAVSNIEREYLSKISKKEFHLYREIYNELVQLGDMDETYRDVLTGVLEVYLTSVSNNLNSVIKRLTVYASYILVPTLITGIYGMNFRFLPEVEWKYGYAFAILLMITSVTFMHIYFKRKGWI